jgi:hypothetical protein
VISYFLYFPFYLFLRNQLGRHADAIGVRHSFYFKQVVFGLSDIDFSLLSYRKLNSIELHKIDTKTKFLGKILPLLGEVNYYEREGIQQMESLINPFEAKRDPLLYKEMKKGKPPAEADKVIFLIRLMAGDSKNLSGNIERRYRKLSYCMSLLAPKNELAKSDLKDLDAWKKYLEVNILSNNNKFIAQFLIEIILNHGKIENERSFTNPELLSLLEFKKYETGLKKELLLANIKWELWGIYTQLPFIKDKKKTFSHILELKKTLEAETNEYGNELSYLVERIHDWMDQP